jgi:folate-binding protein YgfZ
METQDERAKLGVSGDVRREFQVLVSGSGIFRLDRAQITLTGADRVRWLNGMVTNNIRDLAVGHGIYAFLLNSQGKIQADLYVFNRGESLLVETDSTQIETILQIFDRYIIMDEVEVENLAGKIAVIGVAGPRSAEVLASLGPPSSVQHLGSLQFSEVEVRGQRIRVVRGDNPSVPNYELCVEVKGSQTLWDSLLQGGAQEINADTLEIFRVACGIPQFGVDIRQKDLPQETGQERALSFNKGCYVGQEIAERIRSRGAVHRMFTGFEIEGAMPSPGFRAQQEGKDVAEVTSVAVTPTAEGERVLALGYGRKELMVPGQEYVAGETTLRVAALPFAGIF